MNNQFPDSFLWGAATSSHQVEGDNIYNDWWQWEEEGKCAPSGEACDHYNRFREDFAIARELGHTAHRFGIEWSRLEPKKGEWNRDEWNHYKSVLDQLIYLNIEPIVTINHFTLPKWIADTGGWKNDKTIEYFAGFCEKSIFELGKRVKYWITINEPLVLAFIGYFQGKWPPGIKSFDDMIYVHDNMIKAHKKAYKVMKSATKKYKYIKPPRIGIAQSVAAFHPCKKNSLSDKISAFLRSSFQNHGFIKSTRNCLDFIGLNYYFREFVHYKQPILKNPYGWICSKDHHYRAGERTSMGWEIYPKGIYEVVKSFGKYRLPIIITENGLSTYDDSVRESYITDHLRYLLKAINEGSPVFGYLHWSLLDNFEWAEGYVPRFGLIEVDFNTQKRTIKDSARHYSHIIRGTVRL